MQMVPCNFEKDGPIVFALALPAPNDYIDKHTEKHVFNHFYRFYCRCEVRASKSSQPQSLGTLLGTNDFTCLTAHICSFW